MQCHISESLDGLKFREKYGLTEYKDSKRPLIIFGMYRAYDAYVFQQHKGEIILVWQGMDAKECQYWEIVKSKRAKHYAISHWIQNELNQRDIHSTYAPISATIGEANPIPRGNKIYFYTSRLSHESMEYYGEQYIEEIQDRTGLEIITATYDTYTKEELAKVYADCFINLRLTSFDGCPNGNLEMGLLGRRSIFNGLIPGSIKWNNVDDICDSILYEYYERDNDNSQIAELTSIYVNSVNKIFK